MCSLSVLDRPDICGIGIWRAFGETIIAQLRVERGRWHPYVKGMRKWYNDRTKYLGSSYIRDSTLGKSRSHEIATFILLEAVAFTLIHTTSIVIFFTLAPRERVKSCLRLEK